VIPEDGHIDCFFGKNAVKDVYPLILQHLDETAMTSSWSWPFSSKGGAHA